MPRHKQVEVVEATRQQIKQVARGLMAQHGTTGLSLRAIAREMNLTAPALYHYYPSLDDLITALLVDAFSAYAEYIRRARQSAADAGTGVIGQIYAAMLAYRRWALENPVDFQLAYGNPIPGYHAPSEVTAPAAREIGQVFMEMLIEAYHAGLLARLTPVEAMPPGVVAHISGRVPAEYLPIYYDLNRVWSMMHGAVMLDLYHHAAPVVGDVDAFYAEMLRQIIAGFGAPLDGLL